MNIKKLSIIGAAIYSSLLLTGCIEEESQSVTDLLNQEKQEAKEDQNDILVGADGIVKPRNNQGFIEKRITMKAKGANTKEATANALKDALASVMGVTLDVKEREELDVNGDWGDKLFNLNATVNTIEDINLKLNGKANIKKYRVKKEFKVDSGVEVILTAIISYYEAPKEAKRKRIAVFPLRYIADSECESKFATVFTDRVNNFLVHSNNFAVLDRAYLEEKKAEFNLLMNSSDINSQERAKLGNSLATDYMFVGNIEKYNINSVTINQKYTNEQYEKRSASINVTWKLIDVPTGMVVDSGVLSKSIGSKEAQTSDSCFIDKFEALSADVGNKVVDAIYPIPIVSCSSNVITLGRGGEYIQEGQIYNIFLLGKEIMNPYTGESIGRDEIKVAQASIIDTSSKLSHAEILGNNNLTDCHLGNYVVRLDKSKENTSQKVEVSPAPKKPKF